MVNNPSQEMQARTYLIHWWAPEPIKQPFATFTLLIPKPQIPTDHPNFKRDGPLPNNIYLAYQQLVFGNYWFRAELLVINCWFVGICGLGINNGNVTNVAIWNQNRWFELKLNPNRSISVQTTPKCHSRGLGTDPGTGS